MTALAPTIMYCSTTNAETTPASTLGAMGYVAGDLLVVGQFGSGSGSTTPLPPKINGSATGFQDGPDNNGSDNFFVNTSPANGRCQQWSKILSSGDLSFAPVIDKAGYSGTAHRYLLGRLGHADGFDTSRVVQRSQNGDGAFANRSVIGGSWSGGTASLQSTGTLPYGVGDIITVTGVTPAGYNGTFVLTGVSGDTMQYALASNPGAWSSGGNLAKNIPLTDVNRPACAWMLFGGPNTSAALTSTLDGATSGTKYQRAPYFNSSGGSTDTNGAHGNHYSTGTVQAQADYQEYDTADTLLGWLINNNMNSNSHAVLITVYQTMAAPAYLNGKMPSAGNMKGDLGGGASYLNGKMPSAGRMKGDLKPTDGYLTSKSPAASMMGAPAGIDSFAGPGTDPLSTTPVKSPAAARMKGDLLTFPSSFLSGKMKTVGNMRGALDFGSIVPTTGAEFYLKWDEFGKRFYENGLDRGVLYFQDQSVVVWNGLTEITEKFGSDSSPIYYDGRKIGEDITPGDFSAVLKAITYPDKFALVDGSASLRFGIMVGNQRPQAFDLSWRTLINNDLGQAIGYKIHILYNATAIPHDKADATLSDDPSLTEFEWDISAVPQEIDGFAPSAHFVINSLEVDPWLLENLESLLYGNAGKPPNLPILSDLVDLIKTWYRIEVIDNDDGTWTATSSHAGVITVNPDGSFSIVGINGYVVDSNTYIIQNT